MNQLSLSQAIALPAPRVPITIRPGVVGDISFIDQLQKKQSKQVGFFPTKALEGKINAGHVLVAVGARLASTESLAVDASVAPTGNPVGYLIAQDQYFKRDDLGVIYQMNVVAEYRRHLVAASLLKAQFERSAYGCRLYCCWCAQDIEANRFWESMGFVPLAYRAGGIARSRQRAAGSEDGSLKADGCKLQARVHIFWQKRIRQGDTTTPWWFPSETKGGSMMEDRLVFPIPPGTHWSDAKPIVLPRDTHRDTHHDPHGAEQPRLIDGPASRARKSESAIRAVVKRVPLSGGLRFAPPEPVAEPVAEAKEKPKREKKKKMKNDPTYVAATRELRDRWLERVNENPAALASGGKYDTARAIQATTAACQSTAPSGQRWIEPCAPGVIEPGKRFVPPMASHAA